MSTRANPTLIGLFIIGGVALAIVGVAVLASGSWFATRSTFISYFDESVNGLEVGASVKFQGVPVGQVTNLLIQIESSDRTFQVPVEYDIDLTRLTSQAGTFVDLENPSVMGQQIANGLRAQLQMESIVTGQLYIELAYRTDPPPAELASAPSRYPEIPTSPSLLSAFGSQAGSLVGDVLQVLFRVNEMLEEVNQQLRSATKAKDQFLAVMSHELRTPLNAIMGYTDLLDAEIDGPLHPRQRRQLSRIRTSARQLLQLIEEVLGFARLEAGTEEVHLQRLPLGTLARDAAAVAEPFAGAKELGFEVDVDDEETRIETDPGKTRQILVNLLSNAVKFTERGLVALRARSNGEYVVFDVCDTGVGIEDEKLERIFDPFWQVERPNTRRVGGTGLGLSVSQRYARLLGGEIRVSSTPGKGSCFTLTLPLRFDAEIAEAARAAGAADDDAERRFAAMRARIMRGDHEAEDGS